MGKWGIPFNGKIEIPSFHEISNLNGSSEGAYNDGSDGGCVGHAGDRGVIMMVVVMVVTVMMVVVMMVKVLVVTMIVMVVMLVARGLD